MADVTGDVLTFAEGTADHERVRMIGGEIEGQGVLYAEYYAGTALRYAVPYTRVYIEGELTSVRDLRSIVLLPGQTPDGFAFKAVQGSADLSCVALLWGDATANCSRSPAWTPPGRALCAEHFKSFVERFQCNSLPEVMSFPPAMPYEEIVRACSASVRPESHRMDCVRYGYANPAGIFRDTLAACTAAFRTDDERKFCMFYSFAPANPKDRPHVDLVRTCGRKHADDLAVSLCVFELHTGVKQRTAKPGPKDPSSSLTAPVPPFPAKPRVEGGRIDVSAGTRQDIVLRATGGMVGSEPILFVDAIKDRKLAWSNVIDRVVIGKQLRAMREATSIDRVKFSGDILTFRATFGGKPLTCRANGTEIFARCR